MPRTKSIHSALLPLVHEFAARLSSFVEEHSVSKAKNAVLAAFGATGHESPGRGRPAKAAAAGRPRKKPPIQYCPVPGCKNRAAPVFGMVCNVHKNVSKSDIRRYREDRRKAKLKAAR